MKRKYLRNAPSYYVSQKLLIKEPLAHARKITIYFSSIFPESGIPDSTAGRNEVSPLTELLKNYFSVKGI